MSARFSLPIPWFEAAKRTFKEIREDNCVGLAAQLAFYFLLALFPALLFFVALIGYLPIDNALGHLLETAGTVAPGPLMNILNGQVDQLTGNGHASLLTLGFVGAIWSSSSAMVAIIDALNRAYDVGEWRPWWKRRLVAIVLTLALAVFVLVSLSLVLVGPKAATGLAAWLQLRPVVAEIWNLARWPVMIAGVVLGVELVFHFAPSRPGRWVWVTPGSLLATALWLAVSFAFKFYVHTFGQYTATYGAIGGAITTMMWFYVSSLAILVGAELNGVIEHARRSSEG